LLLDAIVATIIGPLDFDLIIARASNLRRHVVDPPRRRKRQLASISPRWRQS
jgi:ribosomal protein S15P/S13E